MKGAAGADRAPRAAYGASEASELASEAAEVTEKWVQRARGGDLAIVMSHKVRMVARQVASQGLR